MDLNAKPETVADAQRELEELEAWYQDFVSRQNMVPAARQRASFLQGFLAAHEDTITSPAEE